MDLRAAKKRYFREAKGDFGLPAILRTPSSLLNIPFLTPAADRSERAMPPTRGRREPQDSGTTIQGPELDSYRIDVLLEICATDLGWGSKLDLKAR
jgi:hypothetical protein